MPCTSSFPFWMCNPSALLFFFSHHQLTSLSSPLPVIHHHILSLLILPHKLDSPPSSFPRYFSFFSTIVSVYPLHLPSKFLRFLSSSVSGNWGGPPRMEICRSTVCGVCVCTGRHWVNVIKGWCSIAKRQRGRREEREGVKTSLNFLCPTAF